MAEVKLVNDLSEKYPSNSRTTPPKKDPPQREKVQPVVKGKTSMQKPSLGEKIKKLLLPGDIKDMKEYAINQVIIPGLKNGALALIEMAFFGQVRRNYVNRNNNQTNYNYISNNQQKISQPTMSQRDRATHNFTNIMFESYQDAEDVISTMLDILDRAGAVTVADFYEAAGYNPSWADVDWGWKGFQKLESRAIRGGYIIDVTPPVYLR